MTDRHYFKMYFANLMSEVSLLVAEERGVYIGILCKIHEAQDAIPNDSQWLGRVCGCSTRRCNQIIADVVQKGTFTTQNDSRIHSLRAKKQLEKERKEAEKLAENGSKSGDKTAKKTEFSTKSMM